MIVDCHAHVFEHWIGPCGHPTADIHKKYLQRMLAHTVASVYRTRDGTAADTKALLDPKDMGWSGLRAVDFRVGRYGRLEFTVDGEEHYAQYMPVGMQEMVAPPDLMLAQMTYAGVDHSVLQAGGGYGAMTSYNCYTSNQYPAKFTALLHVDEALGGTPEGVAEVERGAKLGAKGIYLNFEGFARHGFPWTLDHARMDPLWDRLQALGLVLCTEISSGPTYDVAGYVNNILALGRVLDRFPRLPCHLAMGVPVQYFARGDRWELPKDLESVYKRDDFYVEIMYPIAWGGRWDYPYREAHPLIRDLRDRLGAEKLMWGSDMPNVERFCTYRQSLDYVRRYCDFLSEDEMDLILGKNAARLYRLAGNE